jgi:hypothetical protein
MPPHALALGIVLAVIIVIIALSSAGQSKAMSASVVLRNSRR